jgi:hypothetical protein
VRRKGIQWQRGMVMDEKFGLASYIRQAVKGHEHVVRRGSGRNVAGKYGH